MNTGGNIISKGIYILIFFMQFHSTTAISLSVWHYAGGAQKVKAHPAWLWQAGRCCRRRLRTAVETGKESSPCLLTQGLVDYQASGVFVTLLTGVCKDPLLLNKPGYLLLYLFLLSYFSSFSFGTCMCHG